MPQLASPMQQQVRLMPQHLNLMRQQVLQVQHLVQVEPIMQLRQLLRLHLQQLQQPLHCLTLVLHQVLKMVMVPWRLVLALKLMETMQMQ